MISYGAARRLALALPEAEERDHFGSPSFRVRGKIFAQLSATKEAEQRAVVKLLPADQAALLAFAPQTFASVPHWGRHGWTYVRLAAVESALFADVLRKAWRAVAPRKLAGAPR